MNRTLRRRNRFLFLTACLGLAHGSAPAQEEAAKIQLGEEPPPEAAPAAEAPEDSMWRLRLGGTPVVAAYDPFAGRELPKEVLADPLVPIFKDMEAENWPSAIAALRPILREQPENRAAHMTAVYVFLQVKRERDALALLQTMQKRWPEDFRIINNLAWLYATASEKELRDVRQGIDLARDAVLRTPGDYRVWSTLAECYYAAADFDRAVDTMRKAAQIATMASASQKDLDQYRDQLFRFTQAQAAFRILK